MLLLAATNVCIARLKYGRKIVLDGFASTSSSVIGGEAARRQHNVKTSCGERQGGCRDGTGLRWEGHQYPAIGHLHPHPWKSIKTPLEYNSACWVVLQVQELPAGA